MAKLYTTQPNWKQIFNIVLIKFYTTNFYILIFYNLQNTNNSTSEYYFVKTTYVIKKLCKYIPE